MSSTETSTYEKDVATEAIRNILTELEMTESQLNPRLLSAFSRHLEAWIHTAAMYSKNADFYVGLLDECASHLGADVFVSDDGSIQEEPVRLKIPTRVRDLAKFKSSRSSPNEDEHS